MQPVDVSIIIPTYNRCHLLLQAINSCIDQKNESRISIQIIVVDDCSNDDTQAMLKKFGNNIEIIILAKNGGQCRARNEGAKYAGGMYVKFLDSDDILEKGVLAREVSLANNTDADIVISGWGSIHIDAHGQPVTTSQKIYPVPEMTQLLDSIILGRAVPTSAALYRRSYIRDLEWDPKILKLDDWDWFCRAALRQGKIVALDTISYWMREHSGHRVTKSTMLINALDFYRILNKIETYLRSINELSFKRAQRLAQYYYKELRVLSLYDRVLFEKITEHINTLDNDFIPIDEERQSYMRILSRAIGFKKAILLHSYIKRKLKRKHIYA